MAGNILDDTAHGARRSPTSPSVLGTRGRCVAQAPCHIVRKQRTIPQPRTIQHRIRTTTISSLFFFFSLGTTLPIDLHDCCLF